MAKRQCAELSAPAEEEHIGADHQRPGAQLNRACKGRVEVTLGRSSDDSVQITQGLQPGDRIIVSDMSNWHRYDSLQLK